MKTATIRGLLATVAAAVGLSVAAPPATAAYDVSETQSALKGGSLHNTATNVTTSIIDYVKVTRQVFYNGAYHNKNFWVLRVSAQRCKPDGCYGDILHGTLRPRQGLPGKAVTTSSTVVNDDPDTRTATDEAAVEKTLTASLCYPNTAACVIPWNWLNSNVVKAQVYVRDNYIFPCLKGGLFGFGGAGSTNLSTRMLLDAGLITRTAATKAFTGPAGAAILTLTGCTSGVAAEGYNDILDLWRSQR